MIRHDAYLPVRRRVLGLAAGTLLATVLPRSRAQQAAELRFGLTPVFLDDQVAFLSEWREYLGAKLGRPVAFVQRGSYREVVESWFRGGEAKQWGFATETGKESPALAALDFTKFRNVPKDILQLTLAAAPKGANPTQATVTQTECVPVTDATASLISTAQGGGTATEPQNPQPNKQGQHMENVTVAAPTTQTANSDQDSKIMTAILDLQNQIKAMQTPPVTASPRVEITREGLNELIDQKFGKEKTTKAYNQTFEFVRNNWNELARSYPVNANTDSTGGNLCTTMLASGVVTFAQNRLAPLAAIPGE